MRWLALLALVGCYQSHEIPRPVCETDGECEPGTYCELRFLCVESERGEVDCDPLRAGFGCAVLDGAIDCESERTTGLGLCAPPEARELWR